MKEFIQYQDDFKLPYANTNVLLSAHPGLGSNKIAAPKFLARIAWMFLNNIEGIENGL